MFPSKAAKLTCSHVIPALVIFSNEKLFFWALKTKLADNCLSQTIIIVGQCKIKLWVNFPDLLQGKIAPGKKHQRESTAVFLIVHISI